MGDTAAAALLLLREADVVRLCGLGAAARAMDLLRAHRVTGSQRLGPRLTGTVEAAEGELTHPWLEVVPDQSPGHIRWSCSCATGHAHAAAATESAASDLACDHVAALLTHWIRQPTAFASPLDSGAPAPRPRAPDAPHRPAVPADTQSAPAQTVQAPAPAARATEPPSLAQQLVGLPEAELAMIAAGVLGSAAPILAPHEARASQVYAALCDRTHVADMLAQLDGATARLARDVALLGGSVTRAELYGIAARSGLERPATEATIRTLERRFLLVPVAGNPRLPLSDTHTSRHLPESWRIPAEVLAAMTLDLVPPLGRADDTAVPPRAPATQPASAEPPASTPAIQAAPLRQLCATLALLVHTPGPMHPCAASTTSGAPSRRSAEAAGALPAEPGEPPRATLAGWARMAQVPTGMARLARQVLRALFVREGTATALFALDRLPLEEWPFALRSGFREWLDTPSYAELGALNQDRHGVRVRCDRSALSFQPDALAGENTAARRFLVQLLAHASVGRWLALDALLDLVWRLDPLFLRRRQRAFDTPAWWLEDARTGQPLRPDVRDEWLRGEARYCWALLSGPLHWFGAVDLATNLDGARRAVRLTPLGAYLLGASDVPPDLSRPLAGAWGAAAVSAGQGAIAVQPLAAGAGLLDVLAPWARVVGISRGRLAMRLAPDLVCASFDAAREPDALLRSLRALDQRDGTHAAAALEAVFAGWRARYGQASITRTPVVVEARDAATLAEALAVVPMLAPRCRLVAPDVALVPAGDAPELERALARRGFVT